MALNNDDKKWILGALKPLDTRLEKVETKLGGVETRLGAMEKDIKILKKDVKKIKKDASETVDYLEKREISTVVRVERIEAHLGLPVPI